MRRRRRSHRRGKNHTVRNIVISCFVISLLFATGYSAFQTNITLNVKGNIKEKSRVIRSWTRDSVDDFHNSQYRENIVSATFLNSTNLPNNIDKSWDVSADGKGGVIAYVKINEEDHTKYDLFIGAKDGVIANEDSSRLFFDFQNLENITFYNNFDTSHVVNMSNMFSGGNSLIELDLSSFDTGNVTNMQKMFTAWNDVTISFGKKSLQKIIFGNNFNTANVTHMNDMFSGQQIISLDLSMFNTTKVVNMFSMFSQCSNLESVNVSSFNTQNVKDFSYMFRECSKLTEIDISGFNTISANNMISMFKYCTHLTTIYVSNSFVTTNTTAHTDMFLGDTSLVGGNGTSYDWNHTDKEYARIDTASTLGYFTLKQ